jgi:hypothetical protein
MRIGFMRLIDAAPLVVASARGYFEDEGIAVEIERQGGWMIVRDKLTYGLLDASHSLLGMSIMSQLGRSDFVEPMVAVMNLGAGGSTLVVSTELAQLGVDSPQTLRQIIDPRCPCIIIFCATGWPAAALTRTMIFSSCSSNQSSWPITCRSITWICFALVNHGDLWLKAAVGAALPWRQPIFILIIRRKYC